MSTSSFQPDFPASPASDSDSPGGLPSADSPHLGSVEEEEHGRRSTIDRNELAIVLSRYDIGSIRQLRDYRRGSRRAPKIRIDTDRGAYLLKRRAPGRDQADRMLLNTSMHRWLVKHSYPVAPLIPTRDNNGLALRIGGHAYEMFEYIRGTRDDRSEDAALESGRQLGRLHKLLGSFTPPTEPVTGSYHAATGVAHALQRLPNIVREVDPNVDSAALEETCQMLRAAYRNATVAVCSAGLDPATRLVIHGDWHPGNLLYRNGAIVAVLDFDSARIEPRIIDVANAALQFGMIAGDGDDPRSWPTQLDVRRIRAIVRGYDLEAGQPLSSSERQVLPWLLVEAMIVESVVPIATHGRFGHLSGSGFLAMVAEKIKWLGPRAEHLSRLIDG